MEKISLYVVRVWSNCNKKGKIEKYHYLSYREFLSFHSFELKGFFNKAIKTLLDDNRFNHPEKIYSIVFEKIYLYRDNKDNFYPITYPVKINLDEDWLNEYRCIVSKEVAIEKVYELDDWKIEWLFKTNKFKKIIDKRDRNFIKELREKVWQGEK